MANQPVKPVDPVDPEVDFVNLAKPIWQRKMLVVKLTLMAAVAGFLVSLLIPNQYTSSTMLHQEISDPTITLDEEKLAAMTSLAAIAGVDLSGLTKVKMSPLTFSEIVSSIPFRQELMHTKLNFGQTDTATTLYDYYTKTGPEQPPVNSTSSQPGRMTDPAITGNHVQNLVPQLTNEEIQINSILDKQVTVQVVEDEYIKISCTLPAAVAAAQLTRRTAELLQIYLTEVQTEKPRASLRFIQERFDEAKRNFQKIQADVEASHSGNKASSTSPVNPAPPLPTDYRLAENLYLDLASKLELAKIALNEQTPVFKIINPATIPNAPSSPNHIKITIISAFFGFVLALILILGKDFFQETKEKWITNG